MALGRTRLLEEVSRGHPGIQSSAAAAGEAVALPVVCWDKAEGIWVFGTIVSNMCHTMDKVTLTGASLLKFPLSPVSFRLLYENN